MYFFDEAAQEAAQPGSVLGRSLADAFATFWEGGDGPTHTIIDRKISAAGIVPNDGVSKEKKIFDAFMAADEKQAYILMSGLLEALHKYSSGPYSRGKLEETDAGSKLRRVIEAAGFSLTKDFELSGHDKVSVPEPAPKPTWGEDWLPNGHNHQATANQITAEDQAIIQNAEVKKTPPREIFLVHGHDELNMHKVFNWVIELTGVAPIILSNQLNKGKTLIEKFESYSADSACAIVLMTPDDEARAKREPESPLISRARENVIFELGYFYGKLKRENVIVLNFGVKLPGDINGLVYIGATDWKLELGKELAGLGYRAHL